ncbi:MAG: fibronectin type III domain-containing protein, partial [Methanobacteriota archaeon]
ATPPVSRAGSPGGRRDVATVLLAGGWWVVAAAGVAPTITVAPGATAGTSTASVSWETNETSDSVVEFGATPALGRTTSVASLVTAHTVGLSGLSGGTLYYYRVTSADAAGNRVVSPAGTFTTQSTTANPNPSFTTAIVNIAYTSVQARNVNTAIGLNIINPTGTAMQIDRVRFSALPTLGAAGSEKFFRDAMSTSAGSDPEFACVWTGNNSDTVTCDPAGTFTLPANGMKQVVLNFRTSNLNGDAYTIVTGEVVVTSPVAQTLSAEVNVRHQANGVHMDVMALSGPGGSFAAGHPAAAGGSPIDLNYRWTATANNARIRTRFIVPAGWSDLSVPAQASLASMAVNVRQPTASSFGYVDVGQDLSGGTRDLLFRVTPPAGTNVLVMQVDHDGTKDGSADRSFQSLYWFGVSIS